MLLKVLGVRKKRISGLKILEQFSLGKRNNPELNEDRIVVTDDFIFVMDGVTTKNCPQVNGKSGGRFAVECGEEIIKSFKTDIEAFEAVKILSSELKNSVVSKVDIEEDVDKPAFAFVAYSKLRKQIWRVADPSFMIDGVDYSKHLKLDEIMSSARALFIEIALIKGVKPDDILKDDIGRNFIKPLINNGYLFGNNPNSEYGHGVINGETVPEKFIEIVNVIDANEIIMASDGYPKLFGTLKESEAFLKNVLSYDRLLYKEYKATKCMVENNISFDDRSYIRFQV